MEITIKKTVPVSQVLIHLTAAWDCNPYPWYRKVEYTEQGLQALHCDVEPKRKDTLLCTVTMWHKVDGEDTGHTIKVKITEQWLSRTLAWCMGASPDVGTDGNPVTRCAMDIIEDSPSCDQNTADLVMQVGAYGAVIFG